MTKLVVIAIGLAQLWVPKSDQNRSGSFCSGLWLLPSFGPLSDSKSKISSRVLEMFSCEIRSPISSRGVCVSAAVFLSTETVLYL